MTPRSTQSPDHDSLNQVLTEQLDSAESMLAILDQEYQALLDGDPESLNRVSADKARLVEDLESLERARQDLAPPATTGTDLPANARWKKVLATIEQCRASNLRNGALANARREQITLALNTLRGSGDKLYDGSGSVARGAGSRALGEA